MSWASKLMWTRSPRVTRISFLSELATLNSPRVAVTVNSLRVCAKSVRPPPYQPATMAAVDPTSHCTRRRRESAVITLLQGDSCQTAYWIDLIPTRAEFPCRNQTRHEEL